MATGGLDTVGNTNPEVQAMSIAIYIVAGVIGIPVALIALAFLIGGIMQGFFWCSYRWCRYTACREFIKLGMTPAHANELMDEKEKEWLAEMQAAGRLP
jgi:hypothetical protein